jgi:hypothetical protein
VKIMVMLRSTDPALSLRHAGLVPGIHVFLYDAKTWMAGTSPAMTDRCNSTRQGKSHDRALQTRH